MKKLIATKIVRGVITPPGPDLHEKRIRKCVSDGLEQGLEFIAIREMPHGSDIYWAKDDQAPPVPVVEPTGVAALVAAIEKDFTDRRGLRQEWEQIDESTKAEIREAWTKIITDGGEALAEDEKAITIIFTPRGRTVRARILGKPTIASHGFSALSALIELAKVHHRHIPIVEPQLSDDDGR